MTPPVAITIAMLLLAGNAFFVGAEFAIMTARRSAIEPLAERGNRRATTVMWAMEHVSLMMAAAQIGVTVCSTGLGIVAEPAVASLLAGPFEAAGISERWLHPVSLTIALLIVIFLHVVLGEMVPKNLAVASPESTVLWLAPPLVLVARILRPVIAAVNWISVSVVRLTGLKPREEVVSAFTASEVQSIVEHSRAEGALPDSTGLLGSALEFSECTAADVMIKPAGLTTIPATTTPEAVELAVAQTGFSRFPVLGAAAPSADGTSPDVVGYLHLKDVLYAQGDERRQQVQPWRIRDMAVVSPDDEVEDVLALMQRSGAHLARVNAADGALAGVVFLEDILEELVGEVRDAMQRRLGR